MVDDDILLADNCAARVIEVVRVDDRIFRLRLVLNNAIRTSVSAFTPL